MSIEEETLYDPTTENTFTYHKPFGTQQFRYEQLREKAKELAYLYLGMVPPSRERALAMTKLEESVMWANASIARNEVDPAT